ncbi:MAG: cation:proton antiporter [Pseudomonadales bacterium]|nr:cation:proton antiporter [Pseudomonadales bacterium]
MHYETGLLVLLFVILSLLIGAAVRHLLKGTQIPYTVALLVIGLLLGFVHRSDFFLLQLPMFSQMLELVADISPHLILFIFLPTLIFESAFAMEVHLFRRMFLQITLLAVPGLILATVLTAVLVKWSFPWQWSWALCFLFGALISATDPVAVVALLKEVSSRKRLETLIEGESLLNDGAAIVFFSLFYVLVISSSQQNLSMFTIVTEFTRVVSGGLLIGIALAAIGILWIGRIFNDPMIEISLSIASAYLAFFISESLHVSGVVAVVAMALMYASGGRTRISPEVAGFLHHFWEMMAHMANTLIFIIVGILVASRVNFNDAQAWQALFVLYIGIMIIRASSVALFMPLLKRIGIGINREKAIVLTWGGLRGAVSLALALTVAADDMIPRAIGDQVLFLCAGIVVLTILINGATMGLVLKWLGLDMLPPAKQATVDKAENKISENLNQLLPSMIENEFLKGADWEAVKKIAHLQDIQEQEDAQDISDEDLATAFRRRLLETERKHYWTQFEQGILGKGATHRLVDGVEHALDGEPQIGQRQQLYNLWKTPWLLDKLRKISFLKNIALHLFFERLALGYDVARGFIQAQEELQSHIISLAPNDEEAAAVSTIVNQNKLETLEHIQELRESFPEIIHTLETHTATRLLLNRERSVIQQLLKQAVLDKPEAERMIDSVEARMENLQKISLTQPNQPADVLVQQLPWAAHLSEERREELVKIMEHSLYNNHEHIVDQGKPLCALGIIARGMVKMVDESGGKKTTRTLGPGETLGALSLLSGISPSDFIADALVDIIWLQGDKLKPMMAKDKDLAEALGHLMV